MKALLLACSLLLAGTTGHYWPTSSPTTAIRPAAAAKVYICNNGKTAVYHGSTECSAMRRCSHEVVTTTASKAQASGLRGCMKCY